MGPDLLNSRFRGAQMIKSVTFKNFKALRDTTLPLGPLTLLVGPNGSGKSTALQAFVEIRRDRHIKHIVSAGVPVIPDKTKVEISILWEGEGLTDCSFTRRWRPGALDREFSHPTSNVSSSQQSGMERKLASVRVYSLDAPSIAKPDTLADARQLDTNGFGLPVVLDRLRDKHPERFAQINQELGRWLPEFDQVLFDTPETGKRAVSLRTREGQHPIKAADISQGTLLALTILTLAYLPDPPPIVCLEEPGRGIHPRLLRDIRDAMYRLAYPESFNEKRDPVQVIATTHSPYMLDLFRDHPEEVVIAHKEEGNVIFERLSDREDLEEILQDTRLGDAWYTGILGGIPAEK